MAAVSARKRSVVMTMRKDWMAVLMGALLLTATGAATAGDDADQGQAALRAAYLKAAGRAVDGLPATTSISTSTR
jgi:hypothetical protein